MKLIAVSIVKNEADIIEAFVRHTLAWVDELFLFDHDSTDGTKEILAGLLDEGLPIQVFTDDQLANLQQARSNRLSEWAAEVGADWVLPLDADEILTGLGRPELLQALEQLGDGTAVSIPMLNYSMTPEDDPAEPNPVLRIRYCEKSYASARKILVPRRLALDPGIRAGKGSHTLYQGEVALESRSLPEGFHLSHLSVRSIEQQAARITLAELQRSCRGRAHRGLDTHYRLAFQTLMQSPALFRQSCQGEIRRLQLRPISYSGGPLRYPVAGGEGGRALRALLPFLDKLAESHGRLLDQVGTSDPNVSGTGLIRRQSAADLRAGLATDIADPFSGPQPVEGWGPVEGPVRHAYLPVFHWGYHPRTTLLVEAPEARSAVLLADCLTYSPDQRIEIRVNGELAGVHAFPSVNQRECLRCPVTLRAGTNRLTLDYDRYLQTTYDPRQLAVIFLSFRLL